MPSRDQQPAFSREKETTMTTTARRFATMALAALTVTQAATAYSEVVRGVVSTAYKPTDIAKWDFNRCVPDPIGQVQRLRARGDVIGYNMGAGYPEPGCGLTGCKNHWQGIQRLPVASRRLFAVSSRREDAARFALVRFGTRNTTGRRLRGNRMSTTAPDWWVKPAASDAIALTQVVNTSFDHPGGMQTLGRYLFVPTEQTDGGGSARVYNYDMGALTDAVACDPTTGAGCPKKLWGFVFATNGAALAAAAKIQDPAAKDRYLMITAGRDSNVLDFYFSTPGYSIASPSVFGGTSSWGKYQARFDRAAHPESGFRSKYQNLNLITACTGQLYLVATQNSGEWPYGGVDLVDLFELKLETIPDSDDAQIRYDAQVRLVASKTLYCHATPTDWCTYPGSSTPTECPRECHLDAAAGAYVDPAGRLLLYATEHDNDGPGGSVKMLEFRPSDHLDDPSTTAKEGCPSLTDAFAELYGGSLAATTGPTSVLPNTQSSLLIEYLDRAKRNHARFSVAYSFNDRVQAIRSCTPTGYEFVLFKDINYAGAQAVFPGDGTIHGYSWASNPAWSSGCFRHAGTSTCL
jgi:hypothetical protein